MLLSAVVEAISGGCRPVLEAIRAGEQLPALGLRRAARLPVLAALYTALQRPMLVITDRPEHAPAMLEELAVWSAQIPRLYFPEPAPLFYEQAAWGENTRRERLNALSTLAAYHIPGAQPAHPPLVIATARAVMTRTLPRREFLKATRSLKIGQEIAPDELVRAAVALSYEPVTIVVRPGQFARRGGLLDLWPAAAENPIRLEFFGDEIETIRRFDPATQRTVKLSGGGTPERFLITPAREFLVRPDSPALEGSESYTEFHMPRLHPSPASILDYLPRGALVLIDDRQALEDTITEVEEQAVSLRDESVRDGVLPTDYPIPYLSLAEIQDSLQGRQTVELGFAMLSTGDDLEGGVADAGEASLADCFSPGPRFGGRVKTVLDWMGERWLEGENLVVVSRQASRLQELWNELRLSGETPAPTFIEASLAEGWRLTSDLRPALNLLTDGEIFGWRRPEPRRRAHRAVESPEAGYTDLLPNDYVVHVDHGIGRFIGLVRRAIEGQDREYLTIEYADDAQLFVPIHQADRLTRYVGPDGREPSLSRLGSAEWKNVKAHVKEAVREVAQDLLDLYVRRSVVEGFEFSPDTAWQQELEASFPYIETDDQMRVIAEVKRDMQSPRPMDRLICGDVGYGKTEVALRAAFKAINDGKQVVMLVPTTVLAQQHFNTFSQRLAAFPVTVEMLSRFRNPHQQRDIVQRLGDGQVDIVIGTHRLLSNDVQLKDLGLLIIDEEQRFGVTHKESLKQLRTEVDVLTLTATPIPRTMYMALSGVRDISTINTPPEERLPIITHVGPYSPRLVKQAILRELERGGQVFFVHNRVQTIEAMLSHLKQLVPEARIAIGHGQMPEAELARQMEAFTDGEVDILLCTSIIESGLDIPNANTLIVDRADTFGLAQLYQLRGRVGRGAQRAYAYFFRHNKKLPSIEGRQRLEVIAENTQLGSGFNIAMRDLEIRGAGDLLGTRQHGYIASVGFHLYTALLADQVRKLRRARGLPDGKVPNMINLQLTPVNVELPLSSAIPSDYVPDKTVRLGLYRRMADMRSQAELDALYDEFNDRFGPPPEAVGNLFYQLKVKLLAETSGITSLLTEKGQIVIRFSENEIPADLPDLGSQVRVGKMALWFPYQETPAWREELLQVLAKIAASQGEP